MQASLKWGLKRFKDKGEKAVYKELLQLSTKSTFRPLLAGELIYKEKYAALELLILTKKNVREYQGTGMHQQ